VPVTVGFFLGVRGDLKRERLGLFERRTAVETETGNAADSEVHGEDVALLTSRVVVRRLVHRRYLAVGKRRRIEPRRLLGVLVEPQTNRVFGFHVERNDARAERARP